MCYEVSDSGGFYAGKKFFVKSLLLFNNIKIDINYF